MRSQWWTYYQIIKTIWPQNLRNAIQFQNGKKEIKPYRMGGLNKFKKRRCT